MAPHVNRFIILLESHAKFKKMSYYSYKIEHDFGLAPNPFGGYCTLAVCKAKIRRNRNLKIGDWIIGSGSIKLGKLHHLILLMRVDEIITFNEYWADPRFQYKKPVLNGSLVQMYGDNFYHQDEKTQEWIQEDSAHSLIDRKPNKGHITKDTGGKFVLISKNFYYFGNNCPKIPNEYLEVCCEGRDIKSSAIPLDIADKFIEWVKTNHKIGILGDPISWDTYKLKDIDYGNF